VQLEGKMARAILSNMHHIGMWNSLKKHILCTVKSYREWSTFLTITWYLYYVICNNNK
jgi:hypothetical protein